MWFRVGYALAAVAACVSSVIADEMPVPVALQAALFKKIFDFDRTLKGRRHVQVVVLREGEESELTRTVVGAFADSGITARSVSRVELEKIIEDVSVVYVPPGADFGAVAELCERQGVLSVSGIPDLALRGEVAIGIGIREQKPEILVHMRRVKAERHDLAAGLLELAKVIR